MPVPCKVSSISRSCWAYSVVERWEFCLHNVVLLHYLGIKQALINKIQPRLWCSSYKRDWRGILATCTCVAFVLFFCNFSFKLTSLQTFLTALNRKGRHGPAMSFNLYSNLIRVSKFYLYVPRRMLGYGVGVFCWPHLFSGVFVHPRLIPGSLFSSFPSTDFFLTK